MLNALYRTAATLLSPGLRLMLRRRVRRGKEVAARLKERRGIETAPRPAGTLLWLHGASVGETVSIMPVLQALPATVQVLMTTGTVTSAAVLARLLPQLGLQDQVRHRFVPLDVPRWVARFLDHWRPDGAAFIESEVWPGTLAGCRRRGIPTMLVNARMSPRTFARWRRAGRLARPLFQGFACVHAQSPGDAERLAALGAPAPVLVGNLKFASPPLSVDEAELGRLRALLAGRPVWLAASTHAAEEDVVLGVHARLAPHHPGLLTIIVPRHPERGATLVDRTAPLPVGRRAAGGDPPGESGVYVADTLGELGLFYRLVGHAFVGRSLGARGGQNPLEPARLGCAVAVGPDVSNFLEPVAVLEAAGALTRVADAAALAGWVEIMLTDPARRQAAGEAGRRAAAGYEDLPGQVVSLLLALPEAGRL